MDSSRRNWRVVEEVQGLVGVALEDRPAERPDPEPQHPRGLLGGELAQGHVAAEEVHGVQQ
jgi:hypothetical protein